MNKALFLDRDGVINIEKNYLYKVDEFEFIDGVFELCKHYQDLGYLIIIVTNQSGIARGYYTEDDFSILSSWMIDEFKKHGIEIANVYHCPHHPDISGKCSCRKPEPGMILDAAKKFDIDLEQSILVGDKERDIEAALNAGIKSTYLYTPHEIVKQSKATKIIKKFDEIWKSNVDFK